jgi:hypothetical protein
MLLLKLALHPACAPKKVPNLNPKPSEDCIIAMGAAYNMR